MVFKFKDQYRNIIRVINKCQYCPNILMLEETTLRLFISSIFRKHVTHLTEVLYLFHFTP